MSSKEEGGKGEPVAANGPPLEGSPGKRSSDSPMKPMGDEVHFSEETSTGASFVVVSGDDEVVKPVLIGQTEGIVIPPRVDGTSRSRSTTPPLVERLVTCTGRPLKSPRTNVKSEVKGEQVGHVSGISSAGCYESEGVCRAVALDSGTRAPSNSHETGQSAG